MIDNFVLAFPAWIGAAIAAVFGLALGSFYNVCVFRYQSGESIVSPGSHCPKCGHVLSWWENIPLFSYILLRARCRKCSQPISLRYPLLEFLSGLLAAALAWKYGLGLYWLVYMGFFGMLLVASFIDLDSYILPDMITLPGAALALLASAFILPLGFKSALIGAACGAGSFLALQQGYKLLRGVDGLGTGDIKLMLLIGALIGWQGLPVMVFLSSFAGLIVSVAYLRGQAGKGLQTRIPFGPFLSLGCVLYILWGTDIWAWYLGLLG